jgi:hypothetical protein
VNTAYHLRLLCLCSASFFLVNTLMGLAAWLATPAAVRLAERMTPRIAVRFLLALRMIPAVSAFLAVVGLCVPSYLRLEPESTAEGIGLPCLVMALLGAAVWALSIARTLRAITQSRSYIRNCQRAGRKTVVPGEVFPILLIEEEMPILALAGVIRTQLLISRGVMQALSAEEFEAALRHEDAHRDSGDNFKRLLFLLAPDILPFSRCFQSLELHWARLTEWATDDRSTAGDPRRALSLAAALVRVARMGAGPRLPLFLTSLLGDERELLARVDRLLRLEIQCESPIRRWRALTGSGALALTCCAAAVFLWPSTLSSVHGLLEHLIR